MRRGLVRCLFGRAEEVTLDDKKLSEDRKQLHKVLNANGYSKSFISRATAPANSNNGKEHDWEPKITNTVLCVVGVIEEIEFAIISTLGWPSETVRTSHSELTIVKDPLPLEKQTKVAYRVPCTCGQA